MARRRDGRASTRRRARASGVMAWRRGSGGWRRGVMRRRGRPRAAAGRAAAAAAGGGGGEGVGGGFGLGRRGGIRRSVARGRGGDAEGRRVVRWRRCAAVAAGRFAGWRRRDDLCANFGGFSAVLGWIPGSCAVVLQSGGADMAELGGSRVATAGVAGNTDFRPGEPGVAWRAPVSAGVFKHPARGGFLVLARWRATTAPLSSAAPVAATTRGGRPPGSSSSHRMVEGGGRQHQMQLKRLN